jgi:hypothetical protein
MTGIIPPELVALADAGFGLVRDNTGNADGRESVRDPAFARLVDLYFTNDPRRTVRSARKRDRGTADRAIRLDQAMVSLAESQEHLYEIQADQFKRTQEQFRKTDERIDRLVSAIGETVS